MNRKLMLACLTDRPCAVCKYHSDNGCTQWKCVFEEQPCEDAISRKDAIRVASGYCHWANIPDELAKLPSVSTEKIGHWIRMKAYEKWGCSECNTVFRFTFKEHNYCPNCGAKMEGVEE